MSKRLLATVFAAIVSLSTLDPVLWGQDYVGILPEMLKPDVAEKIGLTDEQRAQVKALIRSRLSAAIGLSQQIKEAPLGQVSQLRSEFNAESEKRGFALLDTLQQDKLAKYRIEWMGMLSLSDPAVATALNLADWQKDIVTEWSDKVRKSSRSPTAERTRNEAQQTIRKEISNSQWAKWQLMAGQIKELTAGPPVPPKREVKVDKVSPTADVPELVASSDLNTFIPVEEILLELNFQGQPWGDVIKWLAIQADLSLQSDVIPPGSFNFRDRSRSYSVTEALDVMNASLLNKGHTLIRQGRMLRCVNFEEQELARELIKEFAPYVSEQELQFRGDYEPVKHLFALNRLDPEKLKDEIEQMLSIQGSVVSMRSSGQLLVTDIAGTVRGIQAMIERAEDPNSSRASSVQTFPLEHIDAEEVLSVARPLLGLEEDTNTSDDIKISTSTFGATIYAMGEPSKMQNLRDLITSMDVQPTQDESFVERETPELKRHKVIGTDLQLAYEIVSQLLAGSPDVHLAQDTTAKQLVLQARSSEHEMVKKMLNDLAGETSNFEVIQLEKLDPLLAVPAIKKFFGLTDDADGEAGGPVIDGDQLARQVWVKGSESEVEAIRNFVKTLEDNASSSGLLGDTIRVIPLTGRSAEQVLNQAKQLWEASKNSNRIQIESRIPSAGGGSSLPQKTFGPRSRQKPLNREVDRSGPSLRSGTMNQRGTIPAGRFISFPQDGPSASDRQPVEEDEEDSHSGADITIMEGPGGLIIHSDDKEALDRFEDIMRLLTDQSMLGGSDPTVIYLQNIEALDAKELLETILSGSSSSGGSGGGGLLGDMAGQVLGGFGGGMMSAMLGGGGGDMLGSGSGLASGDYSITADPRLNLLFVKASPGDMSLIEQLTEIIDQVESPITIQTRGQVALIPVVTQDIEQVVTMIKSLYGDRIQGNSSSAAGRGGGRGGQPNPADIISALRGSGRGGRGGGGTSTQLAEPKISISADVSNNLLIVIAQPQDVNEIRDLVELIDEAGEADPEEVVAIGIGSLVKASVIETGIARIFGPQAKTNITGRDAPGTSTSGPSASSTAGGSATSDAARQAQRSAFFERMRQSGRFGGGTTRGGTGGRGGGDRGGATGGRGGGTGRGGGRGGR